MKGNNYVQNFMYLVGNGCRAGDCYGSKLLLATPSNRAAS